MVAEEIVVSLSGGAPWGFRLQGGAEQQKPLQVAKVRKRSKACRAGLKECDELVAIGDQMCAELSHAQAMSLIDKESVALNLRVKRNLSGFLSSVLMGRSSSPLCSMTVMDTSSMLCPTELPRGVTSPPDSEAYYGETDSDADTNSCVHQRRQRRTSPHTRSPSRYDNHEEDMSEMSGYESATDGGAAIRWESQGRTGSPRRELIYPPQQMHWTTPAQTPHHITSTPEQGLPDAEGEEDSGFQEAVGRAVTACPPLVSPERAKEALKLGSGKHLVPMVGPQLIPVSDELSTTYMDKARQAKLQRGESVVEKQVKEARTKCRSIASLLTDAPNPNSKGVLMFKKRRQRAKKYTLTCFGKAEGDRTGESEAETGGETEEEGGSSMLSGSEVDEEGLSASFDPTWDLGYLEVLEKRSSACPSTTPATSSTPIRPNPEVDAYLHPGLVSFENQSQSLKDTRLDSSGSHNSIVESSFAKQPVRNHMSPPAVALTDGGSVAVTQENVVLSRPSAKSQRRQNEIHGNSTNMDNHDLSPNQAVASNCNSSFNPLLNVSNRTARPFTTSSTPSRTSVTSVMFRPPLPKPTAITMVPKPVTAVSMVTISPIHHPDVRKSVSSTSLYIPPRNSNNTPLSAVSSSPAALSPAASLYSTPFCQAPSSNSQHMSSSSLLSPSVGQSSVYPSYLNTPPPSFSPPSSHPSSPQISSPLTQNCCPGPPGTQTSLSPSVHPYMSATGAPTASPQPSGNDSLETREQRISVPAARTGILSDARHRANKKPMFGALKSKDVSPNPDLLSMVQNLDDHCARTPCVESGRIPCVESTVTVSGEAGHESGPEEDWLRLGAEACNFMQTQRGPKAPPVAPKPQSPQLMQLGGKGGQLFARRQNRMDRYIVERSPSAAAAPYSPAHTREPSPTPSLPATWKYSSNIRAPPPINYNPLLSPSCPPKAQKKPETQKSEKSGSKGKKAGIKLDDIMSHQPYQLNSSLFSYGGGLPQDTFKSDQQRGAPQKTARVYEVKRFSTPPPTTSGLTPKIIVPRSATTLGEPLRYSDVPSPAPGTGEALYQHHQSQAKHFQSQGAPSPVSALIPPAPTAPLPQLPVFSSPPVSSPVSPHKSSQNHSPPAPQPDRYFKSAPDLSPVVPSSAPKKAPGSSQPARVPRPRFSTSNLGLQPCVWRPGSAAH